MQLFWGCRDNGNEQVHERYLCWRCFFARLGCLWLEQVVELFRSCLQRLSFPGISDGGTCFSNVSEASCNPWDCICNAVPMSIYRMGVEPSHGKLLYGRGFRWKMLIYLQASLSKAHSQEIPREILVSHSMFMGQSLSWSCKRSGKKRLKESPGRSTMHD